MFKRIWIISPLTRCFAATSPTRGEVAAQTHEEYVVTKSGVSIAKISPIDNTEDPFGLFKGTVHIYGDIASEPLDVSWEANEDGTEV